MPDKWMIKSHTFGNCNCASNCGCQFNLPSTHGFCQFVEAGYLEDGYFNEVSLTGLKWAFMIIWPGEIAEGNGRELIIIDEYADELQREALKKIILGETGEPGTNHFSVFNSTCSEVFDPVFAPIELEINLSARVAKLDIPGYVKATGEPIVNEFNGDAFHIAIARPSGSFEFTYAEIGRGTASVSGPLEMELEASFAQYCVHHYDQDGLVASA
ncbi:DUF1326 domain-containing protein [Leisingera methylohalidivorans]|uniref:DUF1326 domain-containing protein n=1 Tax=Leisingera methylohalidivorans DSM 14336 TaxID=999552 RepID=V9W3G3_9RHOB|nr:DUF1326 domain-containing protein [Leisingera methylohalidivorans]AHD03687.1 hypothetical protein METH_22925 [Leisingera methylohalidivorans DSM 14336]